MSSSNSISSEPKGSPVQIIKTDIVDLYTDLPPDPDAGKSEDERKAIVCAFQQSCLDLTELC